MELIIITCSYVKQESNYILYRIKPTASTRQIKDIGLKLRTQSKILKLVVLT